MAKYVGENSLAELVAKTKELVATKPNIGITEITTQYVRITDLDTGVYKLSYNGQILIRFDGTSGTQNLTINGSSGAVILTVSKVFPSNTAYWHWYCFSNAYSDASRIYYGVTSSSSGTFKNILLDNIVTSTDFHTITSSELTHNEIKNLANGVYYCPNLMIFDEEDFGGAGYYPMFVKVGTSFRLFTISDVYNGYAKDLVIEYISNWSSYNYYYIPMGGGSNVTITLNGSTTTTPSFYAPTSSISTSTAKRYLVGSSSTTSVATENTNASCYMQSGKLYSNGSVVLSSSDLLTYVYPIGSVYLSVSKTSPASFLGGTWTALTEGYALWTTTTSSTGGNTISAGLPNITGTLTDVAGRYNTAVSASGAFSRTSSSDNKWGGGNYDITRANLSFSAYNSNTIYGSSTTVQPPAIKVFAWKRTA